MRIVAKWDSWCVCGRIILGGDPCDQAKRGAQARHAECVDLPARPDRGRPKDAEIAEALRERLGSTAAELRALREVAEAARAFVPTCEETTWIDEATSQECGQPVTHMDRMHGCDTNLLCAKHAAEAFESAKRAASKGHRSAIELDTPMTLDPDPRVDALRAALAKVPRCERFPLTWPPQVGQRFCLDHGGPNLNNYSAEVRAIVDEDYAVIRRWRPVKQRHTYEILSRLEVEVFNGGKTVFFLGSLPKGSRP